MSNLLKLFWSRVLGFIWRRTPRRFLRWGVRLTQPRFAVSAGAIVFDAQGRVLLLRHVFRHGSGWGLPGGFLHKGEQPEAALRRELREEIGLDVEDLQLASVRTIESAHQIEILYCCRARNRAEPRSFEVRKAAWFAPNELPRDLLPAQRQAIRSAFAAWQSRSGATKSEAPSPTSDGDRL